VAELNLHRVTVTTQPYVRVDGARKQMTHTDGFGIARTLYVDIEFDRCAECHALLLPGDLVRHTQWHAAARTQPGGTDAA
jgi:hypothetical protein